MSDRAREYVKQLTMPWHMKSFLFLIADYHNVRQDCAWPGLNTIAEIMGKDSRNVKRLIREIEQTGKFKYVPGIGVEILARSTSWSLKKRSLVTPFRMHGTAEKRS